MERTLSSGRTKMTGFCMSREVGPSPIVAPPWSDDVIALDRYTSTDVVIYM